MEFITRPIPEVALEIRIKALTTNGDPERGSLRLNNKQEFALDARARYHKTYIGKKERQQINSSHVAADGRTKMKKFFGGCVRG